MLAQIAPATLISQDGRTVVTSHDGAIHQLSSDEAQDLARFRAGPQFIDAGSLELLRRGILSMDAEELDAVDKQAIARDWQQTASLIVMPTEKCNLRCSYCYETFEKGRMKEPIQQGVKAYLERAVQRFPVFNLAWFGGEPLLQPKIILDVSETYRRLQQQHGVRGTLSMTTNGVLFTDALIDQLEAVQMNVYQITLDGPRCIHDIRRIGINGKGTYDRILGHIDKVLSRTSANILLRVNCEPEQATLPLLQDWIKEIIERFAPYGTRVDYTIVPTWDADTHQIDGICLTDLHKFQVWNQLRDIVFEARGSSALRELAHTVSKAGSLACYAGKPNNYVIGADGAVYKCSVAFDRPENRVGQLDAEGNLNLTPALEQLWTQANLLTDPVCGACGFSRACQGLFCPLLRLQTGQRPCPTEKRFFPLILQHADATPA